MNKQNDKKKNKKKLRIKEIIVVEGKDDVSAVKAAVDAEIITTSGLGITDQKLEQIRKASEKRGIIVLTDPDFPGKKIRYWVSQNLTNVKHAYISKSNALKNGNVGVENARPQVIIEALKNARALVSDEKEAFTKKDMIDYGLTGFPNSAERRQVLGELLSIGHCSGKQFLKRLNSYGVTRKEFEDALDKVIEDDE